MKKIVFLLVLILSSTFINAQEINWVSFEEAVKINETNPKPILIDVYTDWCGYCKKMDRTTYSNKTIIAYINKNFHAVKLDGEEKKDITYNGHTFKYKQQGRSKYNEFSAALLDGKLAYPTTIVMNKEVQVLNRIPGYLGEKTMEKILVFFASNDYKTKKWDAFEKDFKSNL